MEVGDILVKVGGRRYGMGNSERVDHRKGNKIWSAKKKKQLKISFQTEPESCLSK